MNIKLPSTALAMLPDLTDVQAGALFKAIVLYQMSASVRLGCAEIIESDLRKTSIPETAQDDADQQRFAEYLRPWAVRLAFRAVQDTLDATEPKKKDVSEKTLKKMQEAVEKKKTNFLNKLKIAIEELQLPYDEEHKELFNMFYIYWTFQLENNSSRLVYETKHPFVMKLRLTTWIKNDSKFGRTTMKKMVTEGTYKEM